MLTMIMISMDLCSVDWNNDFQYCFHIEDCWSVFTDLLTQSVNKHVPVIHIRKSKAKQSIRHYPNYMRKLFKEKAIAWTRWRITKSEYDKNIYKTAAAKCSSAVNKYHAAIELELVRKNSVGSFYMSIRNCVHLLIFLIFVSLTVVCSGGAKGGAAGARAPAVKPCAPVVPRQLSYSDVDHKRIS